jgi:hypothetical protein
VGADQQALSLVDRGPHSRASGARQRDRFYASGRFAGVGAGGVE